MNLQFLFIVAAPVPIILHQQCVIKTILHARERDYDLNSFFFLIFDFYSWHVR